MTQHANMVLKLTKPGKEILGSLDAVKVNILHMTIGISGEAGELLDAVKKHVIYNKPLDRENMLEELGDLEYYMEGLRQCLGVTREAIVALNVAKLSKRYPGLSYSDAAAQARADKV